MNKTLKALILTFYLGLSSSTDAGLILTITEFNADRFSFDISGTFDSDTVGSMPGYLGVRWNHAANPNSHTDFFNHGGVIFFDGNVSQTTTMTIGGVSETTHNLFSNTNAFTDSIYWGNSDGFDQPFTAGTTVSGQFTFDASGSSQSFMNVDPELFSLVSGYDGSNAFTRLEAGATLALVPEPASLKLLFLALVLLTGISTVSRSFRNKT